MHVSIRAWRGGHVEPASPWTGKAASRVDIVCAFDSLITLFLLTLNQTHAQTDTPHCRTTTTTSSSPDMYGISLPRETKTSPNRLGPRRASTSSTASSSSSSRSYRRSFDAAITMRHPRPSLCGRGPCRLLVISGLAALIVFTLLRSSLPIVPGFRLRVRPTVGGDDLAFLHPHEEHLGGGWDWKGMWKGEGKPLLLVTGGAGQLGETRRRVDGRRREFPLTLSRARYHPSSIRGLHRTRPRHCVPPGDPRSIRINHLPPRLGPPAFHRPPYAPALQRL